MDGLPFTTPGVEGRGQPQGAVPVLAPAGSCLLFDRRIYHAATPNWSSTDRSVIFMGYLLRSSLDPATLPTKRLVAGAGMATDG